MAVSFLSSVSQDTPYILPVDLNLLGKVNQYKQSLFYNNANALKQQMAQLKNTDIANEAQRERLQTAYNQVVGRVKEAGPLDFSDMSVVGSIQGLGAQIYDDAYILNGITSTKQMRKVQAYREKIKTDPKLSKFQNAALEWYDNQYIEDYVNGGLDAKYSGPSTPTLSVGNTTDIITKKMKELNPDIAVGIHGDGTSYFYEKSTKKTLTPERVHAMMQGQLTAEVQNQMRIEGAFSMRHMTADQVQAEIQLRKKRDLRDVNATIEKLKTLQKTSVLENEKNQYAAQILDNENYKTTITERYDERLRNVSSNFNTREGRLAELGSIYIEDQFKNLMTAYSYEQINQELIWNQGLMHKERLAFNEWKANLDAAVAREGHAARRKNSSDEEDAPNPLGNDGSPITEMSVNRESKDQKEGRIYTYKYVNDQLKATEDEATNAIKALYLNRTGESDIDLSSLSSLDGKTGISAEDFKLFSQNQKLTENAKTFFSNMEKVMIEAANGNYEILKQFNIPLSEARHTLDVIAYSNDNVEFLKGMRDKALDHAQTTLIKDKKLNSKEADFFKHVMENQHYYFNSDGTINTDFGSENMRKTLIDVLKKADAISLRTPGRDLSTEMPISANIITEALQKRAEVGTYVLKSDVLSGYVDAYFKDGNLDNNLYLPNAAFFNYKNIEKYSSELQSFVSSGFYEKGSTTPSEGALIPQDITITQIEQQPVYGRDNYAKVKFVAKSGDYEGKEFYKWVSKEQAKQFGMNPPTDMEEKENHLLYTKKQLSTRTLMVKSDKWADNPIVRYQLKMSGAGQIQAHITLDGNPIILTKIPHPTIAGQYITPQTSWAMTGYLNTLFQHQAGLGDRKTITEALRAMSLD